MQDAFQRIDIDGCAWGYTNGFALRRGDRWIDPILRAIGLGKAR